MTTLFTSAPANLKPEERLRYRVAFLKPKAYRDGTIALVTFRIKTIPGPMIPDDLRAPKDAVGLRIITLRERGIEEDGKWKKRGATRRASQSSDMFFRDCVWGLERAERELDSITASRFRGLIHRLQERFFLRCDTCSRAEFLPLPENRQIIDRPGS